MGISRDLRLGWTLATLAMIPASIVLWLVGGMAACGEETYDTPPGSVGDSLCEGLVRPVLPWALLASIPFVLGLAGGLAAMRRGDRRLLIAATAVPPALFVLGILIFPAVF
jgi:ABC-type Na+ efflux pump permease subunit